MPRMRCEMEAGNRPGGRESGSCKGAPLYEMGEVGKVREVYVYVKDTSMRELLAHICISIGDYPTFGKQADAVMDLLKKHGWLKKGVYKLYKDGINLKVQEDNNG